MRYTFSLGPFYPGWPGVLRVKMEVEEGVVRAAEAVILGARPLQPEDWAGLSVEEGLVGVERLCAPSSFAHTLAYCQAIEGLASGQVPPRALLLRVILAELERIAQHMLAAAQMLHLAGWPPLALSLLDLREQVLQDQRELTGRRFFAGLNVPGGLRADLENMYVVPRLIRNIKGPLYRLAHRVLSSRSTVNPLIGAGLLTKERAEAEGVGGPVARASESARDLRRDQPYAAYGLLEAQVVTQGGGDVFARWVVLLLEIFEGLRLVEAAVESLAAGPVRVELDGLPAGGDAQARVEAPSGALMVRLRIGEDERLTGLWRTPPSPVLLAVLPQALLGQRLDLVGLIVASWDLYALPGEVAR
jgi:Ni,Fe-hydrogenase III large subunit